MIRLFSALVACLLLAASPAFAATSSVASADALWTAAHAKTVQPGDVITVTAASGALDFSGIAVAAPGLTIQAGPGVKVERIVANNAQGLTFRGFEVAGTPSWMADVYAVNCARIVLDQMKVHSADGAIAGSGFVLRNCTDSAVTNSAFDHVGQGGALIDSDRMTVQGNSFSNIESDAIDVSNTSHARIVGNHFTDFFPAVGDHPDAIQFFAVGKEAADYPTGSLVEDNVIERGLGMGADGKPFPQQGIFVESQDHLTIHRNAISCSLYNAISLSTVNTALVDGNFVVGCADFGGAIITRGSSDHVTVSNNSAPGLPVTYSTATEPPPTNYLDAGGNKAIPFVPVPAAGLAPDTSAFRAWVAANIPAVTPPVVDPPIVPPIVPPVVDPRDAQIAALTAQVATLTKAANDNAAQLAAANAEVATLTQAANDNAATVTGLQAQLATATSAASASAAQVTTLTAQLASVTAADKAQITALNAQVASLTAQLSSAKAQISALLASETGRKKALSGIAATATAAAK